MADKLQMSEWMKIAQECVKQQKYKLAAEYFGKVYRADEDNGIAYFYHAYCVAMSCPDDDDRLKACFDTLFYGTQDMPPKIALMFGTVDEMAGPLVDYYLHAEEAMFALADRFALKIDRTTYVHMAIGALIGLCSNWSTLEGFKDDPRIVQLVLSSYKRMTERMSETLPENSLAGNYNKEMRDAYINLLNSYLNLGYLQEMEKFIKLHEPDYVSQPLQQLMNARAEALAAPAKKGGGCYVATAVYGSYDCPQVWTLRRFRDNTLASTWYGRAFIRTYYAVSPTLVKWFGEAEWFRNLCKPVLDRMVADLNAKGMEDTPYNDRLW